jgi:hypothetical protein
LGPQKRKLKPRIKSPYMAFFFFFFFFEKQGPKYSFLVLFIHAHVEARGGCWVVISFSFGLL